jgi:PPOX class probable F420-dependent enzyme
MATLTEPQREFLKNPFVGTVTTLREDGSPHSTIVWVDDEEDGEISFNTAYGRLKPHNLERDPRVALLVLDPNDAYRWVALDGDAELTTDGADAQIDRLAKKYLGKDEYPFRKPEEQRVTVRITPRRIDSSGF